MPQIRVTSSAFPTNFTSRQLLWDDDDSQQPGAKAFWHFSSVGLAVLLKLLSSIPAAFMGDISIIKQSGVNDKGDPDQPAVSACIIFCTSSPL